MFRNLYNKIVAWYRATYVVEYIINYYNYGADIYRATRAIAKKYPDVRLIAVNPTIGAPGHCHEYVIYFQPDLVIKALINKKGLFPANYTYTNHVLEQVKLALSCHNSATVIRDERMSLRAEAQRIIREGQRTPANGK